MISSSRHGAGPCFLTYVATVALASLAWETAQMPLYTLWDTGGGWDVALNVIRCTGANMVIAAGCLLGAILIGRGRHWPHQGYLRCAVLACALGIGYTLYSEWLNVYVKGTWAYSDHMPLMPPLDVGLSPLMQWLVLPSAALFVARRARE